MPAIKPRVIEFRNVEFVDGQPIKLYALTHRAVFGSEETFASALKQLPDWLNLAAAIEAEPSRAGFLIVHEGHDGVWTLLNRWLDGEMLHSVTFFSDHERPGEFRRLAVGSMACVWELDLIIAERRFWIEEFLQNAEASSLEEYLRRGKTGLTD
ncbi:MAG: hypothetical protein IPN69_22530 [Acidobacteria bacterium]|nr:hypothetical protein [Acidobacteriota bacterium]MBK8813483.1 hypothetical protein [Acidobacteriota bacterium]